MTEMDYRDPHGNRQAIICRMLLRKREIVADAFGLSLCSDPNWDMLLALYLARYENRLVMLTALCAASRVSESTAYRRIDDLEELGLIVRDDDTKDRRRVHIHLSDEGAIILGAVLSRIDQLIASMRPEGR